MEYYFKFFKKNDKSPKLDFIIMRLKRKSYL